MNHTSAFKNGIRILLLISLFFIKQQLNGQKITTNQTGINNGFYYSFWNDRESGSASMLLKPNGTYKILWSTIGNFTAGKGWAIGKADRVICFSGSFNGGENG